jgi:hypothetical protein
MLAKKISDLTPDDLPTLTPFESTSTSSSSTASSESSFFDINWQTWIIIILILAFLGINVFVYLGKGVEEITNIFSPILKLFGYVSAVITNQTIDVSAIGAKTGIDVTAKGTKAGIDIISDTATGAVDLINDTSDIVTGGVKNSTVVQGKQANSSLSIHSRLDAPEHNQTHANANNDNLRNALSDASTATSQNQDIMPDDAKSSIQWGTGKSGWCYIGEDSGTRTCGQVGINDMCMSGDIFPSQEICINPNLRP